MKKILRWMIDFLERKFPDRITVTLEDYDELYDELMICQNSSVKQGESILKMQSTMEEVKTLSANIAFIQDNLKTAKELESQINKIRDEVSKMSVTLGFTAGRAPFESAAKRNAEPWA